MPDTPEEIVTAIKAQTRAIMALIFAVAGLALIIAIALVRFHDMLAAVTL